MLTPQVPIGFGYMCGTTTKFKFNQLGLLVFLSEAYLNVCQISADAKNKNLTFENLSGALDSTVCQV